jgi:transposase
MTETTKINYTEQQTAQMVQEYQAGVSIDEIAKTLGKSVKSVVAKLSREGVYQPKTKAKATSRVTKAALTQHLEEVFQLEAGALETLQKGSHEALEALVAAATNRVN